MYYPAIFIPHDGVFDILFPDLPGCCSQGDNLEQALASAAEALHLHLSGMVADGDKLPEPSSIDAALASARQETED